MGVLTAIASLFSLATVINMFIAVIVIVQALAQIFALFVLRRRQPGLKRPYKQWLYPVPSILALAGWIYVYVSANNTATACRRWRGRSSCRCSGWPRASSRS